MNIKAIKKPMKEQIKLATKSDIYKILPALLELRPHRNETELRELLQDAFSEGYQVIYIGDDDVAYAVLGFRILHFTFSGKALRVDDLATFSNHRKKGYASKLFIWIKEYAKEQNCDHIALDSGFSRHDAHRFYLNQGLFIESLHFGRKISEC